MGYRAGPGNYISSQTWLGSRGNYWHRVFPNCWYKLETHSCLKYHCMLYHEESLKQTNPGKQALTRKGLPTLRTHIEGINTILIVFLLLSFVWSSCRLCWNHLPCSQAEVLCGIPGTNLSKVNEQEQSTLPEQFIRTHLCKQLSYKF